MGPALYYIFEETEGRRGDSDFAKVAQPVSGRHVITIYYQSRAFHTTHPALPHNQISPLIEFDYLDLIRY